MSDDAIDAQLIRNVFEAGQQTALAGKEFLAGKYTRMALVPKWGELKVVESEKDQPLPARKRAEIAIGELESFVRYVNAHRLSATEIFAKIGSEGAATTMQAVFDYHGRCESRPHDVNPQENVRVDGKPAWGQHVANLTLVHSEEWARWTEHDNTEFSQSEFAEFIEDNLADVIEPAGADLLEMARFFSAQSNATFRSRLDLRTGQVQFRYEEQVVENTRDNNGAPAVETTRPFPSEMKLGLKIFAGGQAYQVTARLRYRLNGGKLRLLYVLNQPHKYVEAAAREALEFVEAHTQIKPLIGSITTMNARM